MADKRTVEKLYDILQESNFPKKEEAVKFCGWLVAEPIDKLKIIHDFKDRMEKDYIARLSLRDETIKALRDKLDQAIKIITDLQKVVEDAKEGGQG